MSSSNIGNGSSSDDIDFTKLSLEERLHHKSWKGRLIGYKELINIFNKAIDENDPELRKYWNDPSEFDAFILDANVVAQEQAVLALDALITTMKPLTNDLGPRSHKLLSVWIPSLVEKGLGSSRQHTKDTALRCILTLCSLDRSIETTVELCLPFLEKKLPRLLSSTLNAIVQLCRTYGFSGINKSLEFVNRILEAVHKLASHADRMVRAESMAVIVALFSIIHNNQDYMKFLQDFINDNLKPIQQKDLAKMFEKETAQLQSGDIIQYTLFEETVRANQEAAASTAQSNHLDGDGDTIMMDDGMSGAALSLGRNELQQEDIDPLSLLPAQTILDKLPEDFYNRARSTKWKDRVEALEELHDAVLVKIKKVDSKGDYTNLLTVYANILTKDVNLQAVTLATESIQQIFSKMEKGTLNKSYVTLVFNPLLLRTKEKKATAIEPIRNCIKMICNVFSPLSSSNDDMLVDILTAMKHKIPQIRLESTSILTYLLQNTKQLDKKTLLKKLNQEGDQDAILPIVLKIVNDMQPAMRNVGFECMATLIKILGERYFMDALEHLDNIKKGKIMELVQSLPTFNTVEQAQVIPSKRGPPQRVPSASAVSPIKRSNISNKRDDTSFRNIKLTKQEHSDPKQVANSARISLDTRAPASTTATQNSLLNSIKKDNALLKQERDELLAKLSVFQREKEALTAENKTLQEEKVFIENEMTNKDQTIRKQLNEITSLNSRINDLEKDVIKLRDDKENPSQGRKLSNASSSDDIRRRVDSLRLNSSLEPASSPNLNLNIGSNRTLDNNKVISNDNEESWKRAAEVTRMLKERIEKMRARNR
ncbi:Stu2 protein [Maudiozyma humilis]|uniref:Stu2 protein n=1 Tax=Maudiozyma humilis TaxID=51915 RepID=A0AAV5S610_MAUHU|nr:Stu2 protein [Kazachstania humilis]